MNNIPTNPAEAKDIQSKLKDAEDKFNKAAAKFNNASAAATRKYQAKMDAAQAEFDFAEAVYETTLAKYHPDYESHKQLNAVWEEWREASINLAAIEKKLEALQAKCYPKEEE